MGKISTIALGGLFIVFSICIQDAYTEETVTFIVGVQDYETYLPYSEYKDDEYKGFNRDLLDRFAESKGYTLEYKAYPIKRLYKEFLEGSVDLKYPDNPYWSADLKKGEPIIYSDPVVEYIDGVMVHPDNKGKGVEHLKKLGIVAGFTPFTYLNLVQEGKLKIYECNSYEGLLVQTSRKRLDGAYSNVAVSRYYLGEILKDRNALVFDPDLPHTKDTRHLSSIKYPELIAEFNEFLKTHHDEVEELKRKYRVENGI